MNQTTLTTKPSAQKHFSHIELHAHPEETKPTALARLQLPSSQMFVKVAGSTTRGTEPTIRIPADKSVPESKSIFNNSSNPSFYSKKRIELCQQSQKIQIKCNPIGNNTKNYYLYQETMRNPPPVSPTLF